ncbi:exodeoxyribonuclease VII small subunit [Deinococcus aquiradiocola]|uniref:Exodeoxyribonuclease VII small subunit n=1 Tax=Deinococcus aquiradiocola TaxID=393059 RepID=A0A917PNB5_9DEIO|nr:exodeoxyribonuclease VII small subunit [Deinococcus aquiradiocola]GGJ85553.1 hypothetical protein GCM10008939_31760 [Deinococcus aquiradiocola]
MARSASRSPARPVSYRDAYAALTRIATELEHSEPDLDRVLPLIEEAQAAYAVCRGRIEALQAALGEEALAPQDDPDEDTDEQD